jgi:hypothetical protein
MKVLYTPCVLEPGRVYSPRLCVTDLDALDDTAVSTNAGADVGSAEYQIPAQEHRQRGSVSASLRHKLSKAPQTYYQGVPHEELLLLRGIYVILYVYHGLP